MRRKDREPEEQAERRVKREPDSGSQGVPHARSSADGEADRARHAVRIAAHPEPVQPVRACR